MIKNSIERIRKSYIKEFLMEAHPLWNCKYRSLFSGQHHIENKKIDREMWAVYVSQEISRAKYRLYFNMEWPFLPQPLRKQVLLALQSVFFKGIEVTSCFKNQTCSIESGTNLYFQLTSTDDYKVREYSDFERHDGFSFLIIDNDLIFEPPTKPYHHFRTVFKIKSIKEDILKNLFLDY